MTSAFDEIRVGQQLDGPRFAVTRETIREFCDASLDYNPLHLDDSYMKGSFGKTGFGGIIMHGMTNFGLITRMLTDWLYARGGVHRRLETRWRAPVRPGDTISYRRTVLESRASRSKPGVGLLRSRTEALNQHGVVVMSMEGWGMFGRRPAA